jgi:hypothetical protein
MTGSGIQEIVLKVEAYQLEREVEGVDPWDCFLWPQCSTVWVFKHRRISAGGIKKCIQILVEKIGSITGGERDVSFFHFLQTGSAAHPDSYQMGTAESIPGG